MPNSLKDIESKQFKVKLVAKQVKIKQVLKLSSLSPIQDTDLTIKNFESMFGPNTAGNCHS